MTTTLKEVFKIEGNDLEAIFNWYNIFWELMGLEGSRLEQSPTLLRFKITKCAWQTDPNDISDWVLIFFNIVVKTINPNVTVERPKGMCAGDPYCEYVYKLEE